MKNIFNGLDGSCGWMRSRCWEENGQEAAAGLTWTYEVMYDWQKIVVVSC